MIGFASSEYVEISYVVFFLLFRLLVASLLYITTVDLEIFVL